MRHRTIYKTSAGSKKKKKGLFLSVSSLYSLWMWRLKVGFFESEKVMWEISRANKSSNRAVREHDPQALWVWMLNCRWLVDTKGSAF